jgi:hypothetical protein
MFRAWADPQTVAMTASRNPFLTSAGAVFLGSLLGLALTAQEILIRSAGMR